MVGGSHLQYIDKYAFLFMEARVEDWYLLFAKKGKASSATIYSRTRKK
jgi:hypothetical protein